MNKQNNQQEIKATDNSFFNNFPVGEPFVIGIVLRGHVEDLNQLKDFLQTSNFSIIYKRLSYDKLYITDHLKVPHD